MKAVLTAADAYCFRQLPVKDGECEQPQRLGTSSSLSLPYLKHSKRRALCSGRGAAAPSPLAQARAPTSVTVSSWCYIASAEGCLSAPVSSRGCEAAGRPLPKVVGRRTACRQHGHPLRYVIGRIQGLLRVQLQAVISRRQPAATARVICCMRAPCPTPAAARVEPRPASAPAWRGQRRTGFPV